MAPGTNPRGRGKKRETGPSRWGSERVVRRTATALAEVIPEDGRPWRRLLRLDGDDVSHVDLRDPRSIDFAYVRRFADVVDLIRPSRAPIDAVHVGGGGFTLPRYVAAVRPGSRQEVAEIDPGIVELARAELGLARAPGLRVRVKDGLAVLRARPAGRADLVVLDAFQDGSAIPPHLASPAFVSAARQALRTDGVLAVNVIDEPPLAAARAYAALLRDGFAIGALVAARKVLRGRQGGNVVLLASDAPLPAARLRAKAIRGHAPELFVDEADFAAFTAA